MEERKYFNLIAAEDIRSFIAELNKKELKKDDIVKIFFHPSSQNYYAITYV